MITEKEIEQIAESRYPDKEMDYEQNIDAGNMRFGFIAGAKWALENADKCYEFHNGFKVFKCATTCAGLPNCAFNAKTADLIKE
jgi:hypothetical protein